MPWAHDAGLDCPYVYLDYFEELSIPCLYDLSRSKIVIAIIISGLSPTAG